MKLAVDFHIHFIEVPPPLAEALHPAHPLLLTSAGRSGPILFHQCRTASWQVSIPRSASRSYAFRKLSGNRTYIITTSRMISGEELKYRNGLAGLLGLGIIPPCPQFITSWCICSDRAS